MKKYSIAKNLHRNLAAGLMTTFLAAACQVAGAAPASLQSLDINFDGEIVGSTCTVSIDGDNTLHFEKMTLRQFGAEVGDMGGKGVFFNLLFTDCEEGALSATVYFSGPTNNAVGAVDNKINAEGETTYAEHVGVQVLATGGATTLLKSDDISATVSVAMDPSLTENRRQLMAKLVRTSDTPPTLGRIEASGTLFVTYN